MNERIKELAEQSYDEVPHERDWDATTRVFNKEKFAELIIKECNTVAKTIFCGPGFNSDEIPAIYSKDYCTGFVDGYILGKSFAIATCEAEVLKHFGIKE